jgi:hypothetical protein
LATRKALPDMPKYSAAIGGCLWVWLCVLWQLATGKTSPGSLDYSTEVVGGFWSLVRLADLQHYLMVEMTSEGC